jgi:ribosomal protein S18 acetylase RimI-like enzyme
MIDTKYSLPPETGDDVSHVTAFVHAAYRPYIERIGMEPRPMKDDYTQIVKNSQVFVAEDGRTILGVLVLNLNDEGFVIENIAVDPAWRARGIGRALLNFAETEARRAGSDSIYLYTYEKMVENQALYTRFGYIEYDRRSQGIFSLVYMRKHLSVEA